MPNSNDKFDVREMAKELAVANNVNAADLFSISDSVNAQSEPSSKEKPDKKKREWVPDQQILDSMSEFASNPVTFSKDDLAKFENDGQLRNIADDMNIAAAIEQMDEMQRIEANINVAKKRWNISKLQIPAGYLQIPIINAASINVYQDAQNELDKCFNELVETYPDAVMEWIKPKLRPKYISDKQTVILTGEMGEDDYAISNPDSIDEITDNTETPENITDENKLAVIIDKSSISDVSWTPEDYDKIRKSRTIELSIVEGMDMDISSIEDADAELVDKVISQYHRSTNDVVAALPASRYRATFSGLTFGEFIDLSNAEDMNSLDGDRAKWSVAFKHIHNPSIGDWEEYKWYIDPVSKKKLKLSVNEAIPGDINVDDIHYVSKFEDFLQKTAYIDLDYILWKILCATSLEKEIVTVTCRNRIIRNTEQPIYCNHKYDWVYSPEDLWVTDNILPEVLEELKTTMEASSTSDIMTNYNSSMLRKENIATLPVSKMKVVFGHISAYEYLNEIGAKIRETQEMAVDNPVLASRNALTPILAAVKSFLVEDKGKYKRISGSDNIMKIVSSMDEIDWGSVMKLLNLVVSPYTQTFAIKNTVCPKCKKRSKYLTINITDLLFIVAQSLMAVKVELKRS